MKMRSTRPKIPPGTPPLAAELVAGINTRRVSSATAAMAIEGEAQRCPRGVAGKARGDEQLANRPGEEREQRDDQVN